MISPVVNSNPFNGDSTPAGAPSAPLSTLPFLQQIETALEQFVNQSGGSASPLHIDIRPSESATPGTRQFVVTVETPKPAESATSTASSTAPPPQSYVNVP